MPFLTPLRLEDIDGDNFLLTEPLIYRTHSNEVIEVPAGFVTDFASIPRFFWRIYPPSGKYNKAAVVHDYLYRYGIGTKADADRIFREAMEDLGVNGFQRWTMYYAVKFGGKGNFQ